MLLMVSGIMISCTTNDCKSIEAELANTKQELAERDAMLDDFGTAISAVDSNLEMMSSLERELAESLQSSAKDKRERIQENVNRLKELMASNRDYLGQMQETLDANRHISANLMSVVESMQEKVMMNNLRLARHNNDLETLGDDFKNMFEEYIQAEYARMVLEEGMNKMEGNIGNMENQMRELKNYLNTAYYAIGTRRELIESGVLEKGGLLKSKEINEDLDKMAFRAIDVRKIKSIALNASKVKLVTEHPTESYEFIADESGNYTIEITLPESFWSLSKYLIVIEG